MIFDKDGLAPPSIEALATKPAPMPREETFMAESQSFASKPRFAAESSEQADMVTRNMVETADPGDRVATFKSSPPIIAKPVNQSIVRKPSPKGTLVNFVLLTARSGKTERRERFGALYGLPLGF